MNLDIVFSGDGFAYAREFDEEAVYSLLISPIVNWFKSRYGSLTPPQKMAIPYIKSGYNILVSSPTGTGKTLAVFLPIIDDLYRLALNNELKDQIYVIYVSPLRALNNDMQKNLIQPLAEIREYVRNELGVEVDIRVAVRTSDTLPSEKSRMLRSPPHILITTPESLALALNAPKFREKLATVRWVVVDEVHEMASSKRGSHLVLSLERLVDLVGKDFQRIGLSATISPLEDVARFLAGFSSDGSPRPIVIADARFSKPIDIRVVTPRLDLVYTPASVLNEAIYEELTKLVLQHRTTLVFTNTRSATESVVYKLKKSLSSNGVVDADEIEAHHSSLSRDVRLEVEDKLKKGLLRVVVSSTSLELGIDIGYIDLVALLSSPKSVTRLLQRVGRAGHNAYEVSKGVIIVVDRDDLIECAVLSKLALERKIDRVKIPRKPLDILAQHIVGMAIEKPRTVDEILAIVRRSYTYHDLSEDELMTVINYLAGRYPSLEDYNVYAKIRYDEETKTVSRRKGARMIYQLNVGAIPDEVKVAVFAVIDNKKKYIGDLEEGFVEILTPGDIFVLGGKTYKVLAIHPTHVVVEPAKGERPTVPSWFSEMLPLAYDSAIEVGKFRRVIAEMIKTMPKNYVIEWLIREYRIEPHAAEYIYDYIYQQLLFTKGKIPSDKLILVEIWPDREKMATNIIFHSLFGRRVNDVLSRAYAYVLADIMRENVKISVTDNGFMLTIPGHVSVHQIRKAINSVSSQNVEDIARRAVRKTELFKKRFRHCAERAFMLLRRYKGVDVSIARRQVNAEKIIQVVEKYEKFPIIEETYREILEDFMDLTHAKEVLRKIESGEIKIEIIESFYAPSPFAHNIVAYGYSDVVLMEDKRKLIARLQDMVKKVLEGEIGQSLRSSAKQEMGVSINS
ncbi:MAG: ATP-dependent helicase [Ignisphaera sp.]